MTFTVKKPEDKVFGKNVTKVLSFRVPENQFETIKIVVNDYIVSYNDDNVKKINTVQDNIKEIISIFLDMRDYIKKEWNIPLEKYHSILFHHNEDLIKNLIDIYPVKRKTPIKTLTEEKKEKEEKLKKKNERESSLSHVDKIIPPKSDYKPISLIKYSLGSPEYNKEVMRLMKATKR